MENSEVVKVIGLVLGLVLVLLLNSWLYPDALTNTVIAVLAAP